MGILDEAIRQHLDLKRRQGADDDELKRLEDEAFGPPTRPGEPDFPGQAPAGPGGDGANGGVEGSAAEPQVGSEAAVAEPPSPPGTPEVAQTGLEAVPTVESGPETEETPSGLDESTETQTPPSIEAEGEPESATEPDEESTSFFDQSGADSLELGEIDLDLDKGLDEVREIAEPEPPAAPRLEPEPSPPEPAPSPPEPEPTPPEPPIESLDTVEHQVEDVEEVEEVEEVEKLPAEPPAEDSATGDPATDEDMLEETPEFLRDAPENDELWFEQGEPKDFDFDD